MDYVVLLWFVCMFFPLLGGIETRTVFVEIIGSLYLVILYFVLRVSIDLLQLESIGKVFVNSAWVAAFFALSAWILYVIAGIKTPLVLTRYYPYLGDVVHLTPYNGIWRIIIRK